MLELGDEKVRTVLPFSTNCWGTTVALSQRSTIRSMLLTSNVARVGNEKTPQGREPFNVFDARNTSRRFGHKPRVPLPNHVSKEELKLNVVYET